MLSFFNDAKVLRAIHGGLTIFWVLVWIAAAVFGWLSSVIFVSHLSAAALVLASWSSWQATRVEVKEDEKENNDQGVQP